MWGFYYPNVCVCMCECVCTHIGKPSAVVVIIIDTDCLGYKKDQGDWIA